VRDLVTNFDDFADDAKVRVQRLLAYENENKYVIRNIVNIEKDDDGDVILIAEIPSIQHNDHEESEKEKSEDQDFDFEKE